MPLKKSLQTTLLAAFAVSLFGLANLSGCSSSSDTTVITPNETFREDPAVAEEKAKAAAASQSAPL